jgi:hypothetical protein
VKLDAGDIDVLQPIIQATVRATLAEIEATEHTLGDRLAYPEAEAAALLGIPRHVLRDCRLRGEIIGRMVGKRVVYSREALVRFLAEGPRG